MCPISIFEAEVSKLCCLPACINIGMRAHPKGVAFIHTLSLELFFTHLTMKICAVQNTHAGGLRTP
jgi:hypothetical protein